MPLRIAPDAVKPVPAGATERIVGSITAAIVERRLMPGTKLSEQKIADIFEVSRTLVRQALHQLSRDRLVTLEPARGASVAVPSVDEAKQVFQVRAMLEGALARQLCARITDSQIVELRAHLRGEVLLKLLEDPSLLTLLFELSLEPLFENSDCVCVRLDTPLGVLLEEATPASFAPVGPSGDAQRLVQPLSAPPAASTRPAPTPVVVAEVFAQLV